MKRLNKYKKYGFYNKSKLNHSYFSELPKKIYTFKKTKWKSLQEFGKLPKNKKFFINNSTLKLKAQNIEVFKLINSYKNSWQIKNNLNLYFNNSLKRKFWQKLISKKNIDRKKFLFLNCLVYPEFKIDLLLDRLKIYTSNYSARQAIQRGEVLINDKKVSSNYIVKKGDIISFSSKDNVLQIKNSNKIFPFLEIDFYTKTIIIISNWDDLNFKECYYFIDQFFDLQKFKEFI